MEKLMLQFLKASALALAAAVTLVAPSATPQEMGPLPVDHFSVLDTMTNVSISPDGEYLAYRLVPAKGANAVIQILETGNLEKEPFTAGATTMDITGFSWIGNDTLWVNFRQQVREDIDDTNQGVYESRSATLSKDGSSWDFKKFRYIDMSLSGRLLKIDPDRVLVRTGKVQGTTASAIRGQAISAISTPDYYMMDIRTHRLQLKAKVGDRIGGFLIDRDGDIRTGTEFDPAKREEILYARDKGSEEWRRVRSWPALDDRWSIRPIGIDPLDENKVFILSNQGQDKTAVYLMSLESGEIEEEIYRRDDVDIMGGWFSSDPDKPGHVAGFYFYENGRREIAWIDEEERAKFDALQAALPGKEISIPSQSFDGRMIVYAEAGTDPGSYYFFQNDGLQKLGSRNPLLKPEDLGEVSFIRWNARDGRSIPGYLTTPPRGSAPFPLIVLPHGGPEVSEHIVYDEWAQMLANQGYMVLQPGYRGTLGYGITHASGIYKDWGGKAQDDKDDGALYLVEQGLVDRDRIAMFGWSYGGYAAMVASLRTPNIYQCAIAGAGVSDLDAANAEFGGNRISRSELKRTREGGLSPIEFVEKVNIPILVIHGEHDQRVQINQSDRFVDALKRNNKFHKYIVLEDADHFSNTINAENAEIMYTEILRFLREDCGPGGL
jgi:dipeptidyl aminopeptidase/acylaminoacyl peptidase